MGVRGCKDSGLYNIIKSCPVKDVNEEVSTALFKLCVIFTVS